MDNSYNQLIKNGLNEIRETIRNSMIPETDLDSWLYYAVSSNYYEMVQFLLDHGANINLFDHEGSILQYAIRREYFDIALLLIQQGADVNFCNKDGEASINYAINADNIELVRIIVDHGANINTKDYAGYSPATLC